MGVSGLYPPGHISSFALVKRRPTSNGEETSAASSTDNSKRANKELQSW